MTPQRYKCLFGGRGSGKSWAIADALLITGLQRKIRVLCAREFQNSIKESVHALLKERIEALGLSGFYSAGEQVIKGQNGSYFFFKGVNHHVDSIKSMTGLTHLWIEEAQVISKNSWDVLVPTIRKEDSEIWVSFNPLFETDPIWKEMVAVKRSNIYLRRINWDENPHFPEVLNQERLHMQETDPDLYHHIWEGGFWQQSDAQVFNGKWIVQDFEPGDEWNGPYLGADFGFAQDPTTLIKCWVFANRLYVERESWAIGLDTDLIADRWLIDVPDCDRFVIRADSARPDTISYLARHGLPKITGVKKGPGSVEDGIAHLRSYDKIVIHSRCVKTQEEMRLYSYKRDRLSGDVLPVLVDAYNHLIDSARYACNPLIKPRRKTPPPVSAVNW